LAPRTWSRPWSPGPWQCSWSYPWSGRWSSQLDGGLRHLGSMLRFCKFNKILPSRLHIFKQNKTQFLCKMCEKIAMEPSDDDYDILCPYWNIVIQKLNIFTTSLYFCLLGTNKPRRRYYRF
jgi:hypothetical protein